MIERVITKGVKGCDGYREAVARMPEAADVDAVAAGGLAPSCFGRLGLVTRVSSREPGRVVHYVVALVPDDTVANGCGCSETMAKGVLMRSTALTCILNSAECDELEEQMRKETETMKSLILYGSQVKLTNAHKLVTGNGGYKQPAYYVRADVFNGDHSEALDKAMPLVGEVVLNTVPISEASARR